MVFKLWIPALDEKKATDLLCVQPRLAHSAGDRPAGVTVRTPQLGWQRSRGETNSESYADELFGALVARHGLEWFAGHVSVHGAKPAVFRSIANAIRYPP